MKYPLLNHHEGSFGLVFKVCSKAIVRLINKYSRGFGFGFVLKMMKEQAYLIKLSLRRLNLALSVHPR